jgi:HEAT repeat protein
MRSLYILASLVLSAGLLHGAAAADPAEEKKEPEADGKTLSEWARLLQSDDVTDRQAATLALAKIGPEAAPALTLALNDKQIVNVRLWAANALGKIGPKAKGAVPQLEAALKDEVPYVRVEAGRALWRIDKNSAAVPALIEALKDKDTGVRYMATEALGGIGPDAKAAVPALVEALKDPAFAEFERPDSIERRPLGPAAGKALKQIDPETAKKYGYE